MRDSETSADERLGSVDPLEALRNADSRAFSERLVAQGRETMASVDVRSVALSILIAAVVVMVGWRMFAGTDPVIEQSLPMAGSRAVVVDTASPGSVAPAESIDAAQTFVHVAGAVHDPGLWQADVGWRVADAIDAAGGATSDADLNRINLAAHLIDGQRIYVPSTGEEQLPVVEAPSGPARAGTLSPININAASATELEELPGVGPATAAAIVSHREEFGAFASVDALIAVPGIGPAKVGALADDATV